jgi:hypothetical protein
VIREDSEKSGKVPSSLLCDSDLKPPGKVKPVKK